MSAPIRPTRFLAWLFGLSLAALLVIGTAAYLADPFGYFRHLGLRSQAGPLDGRILKLGKSVWGSAEHGKGLALSVIDADTIVVGTSRVGRGLQPDDPSLPAAAGRIYNLGLPGADAHELIAFARYAAREARPRRIVIELQMLNFRHRFHRALPGFVGDQGQGMSAFSGLAHRAHLALWSRSAVKGIGTVLSIGPHYELNGFLPTAPPRTLTRKQINQRIDGGTYENLRFNPADPSSYRLAMHKLRSLRDELCAAGIELKVYIGPTHIRRHLLYQQLGLDKAMQTWRREMLDIVETGPSSAPNGKTCQRSLTDFSLPSRISTTTFADTFEPADQNPWFIDSIHYRPKVWPLLAAELWPSAANSPRQPLGVRLTRDNLSDVEARFDQAMADYRATHPQMVDEIVALTECSQGCSD